MAKLTIKNLIAPLTNKTHMLTIVSVTVLFGIFRLSGGYVGVKNQADSVNRRQQSNQSANDQITGQLEPLAEDNESLDGYDGPTGRNQREREDPPRAKRGLLDQLSAESENSQKPKPVDPKKRGGLDEIEKAMGLR